MSEKIKNLSQKTAASLLAALAVGGGVATELSDHPTPRKDGGQGPGMASGPFEGRGAGGVPDPQGETTILGIGYNQAGDVVLVHPNEHLDQMGYVVPNQPIVPANPPKVNVPSLTLDSKLGVMPPAPASKHQG